MSGTAERVGDVTLPTPGWDRVEERAGRQRAALRAYVDRVNARDLDGLVALFAEDAVIEDPYGGLRHNIRGIAEIRAFYAFVLPKTRMEARVVTGSSGDAAAIHIRAHVGSDVVDNISIANFDDAGRITRYTTYWAPADRRPAREVEG